MGFVFGFGVLTSDRTNSERSYSVVHQEQNTLPVKNAKRMHENVRLFDGAIKGAGVPGCGRSFT